MGKEAQYRKELIAELKELFPTVVFDKWKTNRLKMWSAFCKSQGANIE